MKITFLGHSGFLVDTRQEYLLFDYFQGSIPELSVEKPLYVFVSHKHQDHFNPVIFKLAEKYPRIQYILSYDIKLKPWNLKKWGIEAGIERKPEGVIGAGTGMTPGMEIKAEMDIKPETGVEVGMENKPGMGVGAGTGNKVGMEIKPETGKTPESEEKNINMHKINIIDHILSVRADAVYHTGDLEITTMKSTDEGVAFLVKAGGRTIYHAGDLNWWYWEEESKQYNNNMTADFKRQIDKMKGMSIDFAFLPLDPRQEQYYCLGFDYMLETASVKTAFPMHMWGEFSVVQKWLQEGRMKECGTNVMKVERDGQEWEFK